MNRISGVMVTVLAASAVGRGFEPQSCQDISELGRVNTC
jgi:hypothetical protein